MVERPIETWAIVARLDFALLEAVLRIMSRSQEVRLGSKNDIATSYFLSCLLIVYSLPSENLRTRAVVPFAVRKAVNSLVRSTRFKLLGC